MWRRIDRKKLVNAQGVAERRALLRQRRLALVKVYGRTVSLAGFATGEGLPASAQPSSTPNTKFEIPTSKPCAQPNMRWHERVWQQQGRDSSEDGVGGAEEQSCAHPAALEQPQPRPSRCQVQKAPKNFHGDQLSETRKRVVG